MSDGFPGPRPIHGDSVRITTDTASTTFTGTITSQGVLRDGRGCVELTLPGADPQQRRDLEQASSFRYDRSRDGARFYPSPQLVVRETRREKDGALVVTGSP
ncbi:hypothetical protein ACIQPR_42540 [Streptomyces sp. NPDC091280]|uniref:hypothetical protein n=1 Tax=Streptomyces sp. NPDC091280 TaxID=3365984 RepID=UPI00380FEEE6